jgi:hypothetical protein
MAHLWGMDRRAPHTPREDTSVAASHPALVELVRLLGRLAAREALASGPTNLSERTND